MTKVTGSGRPGLAHRRTHSPTRKNFRGGPLVPPLSVQRMKENEEFAALNARFRLVLT